MKLRTYVLTSYIAILALGLSACGDGGDTRTLPQPAAQGRDIFQRRCAACHATGTETKVGPGLTDLFAPGGPTLPEHVDYGGNLPNDATITEANVGDWIRQGGAGQIGTMPAVDLNDQELAAVIAYLQTLPPNE